MTTTHILETTEADIAYDVHGALPAADGRAPLFMIGQPMDASGFGTLASHFPDRTVVTYDPRGLGRSTRKDGRTDNAATVQAVDVHAVIEALGVGPVEMFARSSGAVTALALFVTGRPSNPAPQIATQVRTSDYGDAEDPAGGRRCVLPLRAALVSPQRWFPAAPQASASACYADERTHPCPTCGLCVLARCRMPLRNLWCSA